MEQLVEAYKELLETSHRNLLKALEGLPTEALDWSPGTDMNSISVLVFHLTGAERYWIGDVALGEPSGRDRDAEFRVRAVGTDILKNRLADTLAYSEAALGRLSRAQLEQVHTAALDGRTVTGAWAVLHALEHATLHLGQIQLTRQLWEQSQQST